MTFIWEGKVIVSPKTKKRLAVEQAVIYCEKKGFKYRVAVSRINTYATVVLRVQISKYLASKGFAAPAISYAVNRDEMTVRRYLKHENYQNIGV